MDRRNPNVTYLSLIAPTQMMSNCIISYSEIFYADEIFIDPTIRMGNIASIDNCVCDKQNNIGYIYFPRLSFYIINITYTLQLFLRRVQNKIKKLQFTIQYQISTTCRMQFISGLRRFVVFVVRWYRQHKYGTL